MFSPFLIPLAIFAMVVVVVAITNMAKLRSFEVDVHQKLHFLEFEHQRKMQELELKLQRITEGKE